MGFSDIAYVFIVLIVLIGVMYSLLFLVKKYFFKQGNFSKAGIDIQVLTTQPLLPKKFISVVKVHKNYFVLGISDSSINLIEKLDDVTEEDFKPVKKDRRKMPFLNMLKENMTNE